MFEPTRPNAVSIAERRRPDPQGRPGFLRVDTVHQGDWDGAKGVYHINAVDTVTQWQVVGCLSKISEQFLIPVLEAMLQQFPFGILGFHSDNGSEFINRRVAELLEKLLIEFTKSRASRTQDNALVEGKNGAISQAHRVRSHCQRACRSAAEVLYRIPESVPQLPPAMRIRDGQPGCARQAPTALPGRGLLYSIREAEILPEAASYLKPATTFEQMGAVASAMSDTDCVKKMSSAKAALLRRCKSESPIPPRFI